MRKQVFIANLDFANTASVYVVKINIIPAYRETRYFIT